MERGQLYVRPNNSRSYHKFLLLHPKFHTAVYGHVLNCINYYFIFERTVKMRLYHRWKIGPTISTLAQTDGEYIVSSRMSPIFSIKKFDTIIFNRSTVGYISSALSDVSARGAKFQSK